jgi:hypothetical protein
MAPPVFPIVDPANPIFLETGEFISLPKLMSKAAEVSKSFCFSDDSLD